MKRYGGLWDRVVSWDNLVLAARKARRRKRSRLAVQAFEFGLERHLLRLHHDLTSGEYRPGPFRSHTIHYPKPRLISAAPYRDRVVHHALMNVLQPILDRHFHPDSYACRESKGTHAAADRLQALMRGHGYALQCDVRRFFPSIDHAALKTTFRRLIKDARTLGLMDMIVDHGRGVGSGAEWFAGDDLLSPLDRPRGLPIGNLTSQWFANWMLNDLDHFVTSRLGIGAYVRYCDDFILLHDDRQALRGALAAVRERLASIRLKLHEQKAFVRPARAGLTFVGYRLWPTHRLIRKPNIRAFRRRVRFMREAYAARAMDWSDIKPRLASWVGHARQADSTRLLRRLSREWRFSRGGAVQGSCDSRRRVEQQCNERRLYEPQQQHALQSEQQQRVPSGPALSWEARGRPARNLAVHGPRERGEESPGSAPVLPASTNDAGGRMHAVGPGGAGTPEAERPIRPRFGCPGPIDDQMRAVSEMHSPAQGVSHEC